LASSPPRSTFSDPRCVISPTESPLGRPDCDSSVRFADFRSVTRSVTLDAPISATTSLAEIAEELVRAALTEHSNEKTITLVAISVLHLESRWDAQLELPLDLADEKRRSGTKRGMARCTADRAIDMIPIASDGTRPDTDQSCWDHPGPFPMSFASSPKRTSNQLGAEVR
jgi:hypothetical protein